MNDKILQFAIDHLTAEEARLKAASIEADKAENDAREKAQDADTKWRECHTALRALKDFTTESEVRF